jgi:hypothetical protein
MIKMPKAILIKIISCIQAGRVLRYAMYEVRFLIVHLQAQKYGQQPDDGNFVSERIFGM